MVIKHFKFKRVKVAAAFWPCLEFWSFGLTLDAGWKARHYGLVLDLGPFSAVFSIFVKRL